MTIGDEKVVSTVCLISDMRLPHFASAEMQLFNGHVPTIGDRFVLHSAYAELAAERDSAVSQARTTQWLLDQALETIKFNGKFTEALANDLKAAGVKFSNENGVTITNERAQAAASQLAELRATLQGIADADYREWDDGFNTPLAFVDWAKSRAAHAISTLAAAEGG